MFWNQKFLIIYLCLFMFLFSPPNKESSPVSGKIQCKMRSSEPIQLTSAESLSSREFFSPLVVSCSYVCFSDCKLMFNFFSRTTKLISVKCGTWDFCIREIWPKYVGNNYCYWKITSILIYLKHNLAKKKLKIKAS